MIKPPSFEEIEERLLSDQDLQNAIDLFFSFRDHEDFVSAMVNYLAGQLDGEELVHEIDFLSLEHKRVLRN